MKVFGHCIISSRPDIIDPATGKMCLEIKWPNETTTYITTNLAEMIGGAGAGVRQKQEDQNANNRTPPKRS